MDIRVENHGSIFLLCPVTTEALTWITGHVPSDALWYSGALVVEPRYVADIVQGARDDGLEVA